MNVSETSIRSTERPQGTFFVSIHLGFLADHTGACPLPYVFIHTGAAKSFCCELYSCSHAWMRRFVQHTENFASMISQHYWTKTGVF